MITVSESSNYWSKRHNPQATTLLGTNIGSKCWHKQTIMNQALKLRIFCNRIPKVNVDEKEIYRFYSITANSQCTDHHGYTTKVNSECSIKREMAMCHFILVVLRVCNVLKEIFSDMVGHNRDILSIRNTNRFWSWKGNK